MRRSCAPRWTPPSAAPTPTAPGTGRQAYDACEGATVLFLRKYGKALLRKAGSPAAALPLLAKIADLLPTHTRRSEESEAFQQFSTPLALGFAAATAAAITARRHRAGAVRRHRPARRPRRDRRRRPPPQRTRRDTRAISSPLSFRLYPVTRFDAAQIDDHLDAAIVPSVVLMNPPFSAMANVSGRMADAAYRHVASALARLAPSGRLVAITGASFAPDAPRWRDAFVGSSRKRARRLHSRHRWRGLRAARHDHRHAIDSDRQDRQPTIRPCSRHRPALPPMRPRCSPGSGR